jgi:hypothetical protein
LNPKEAWDRLKEEYEPSKMDDVVDLQKDFSDFGHGRYGGTHQNLSMILSYNMYKGYLIFTEIKKAIQIRGEVVQNNHEYISDLKTGKVEMRSNTYYILGSRLQIGIESEAF